MKIYIIRPKPGPVAKNATPRPSGWESNRVLTTFGARNSEKFDVASFGDHKRAFYLIPQNCFSFVFSPLLESQIIQYLRFYMNKNAFDKKT